MTHHVEEILPEFTHVLMLRKGRLHFQGPIADGLRSKLLSEVFSAPLKLSRRGWRYSLQCG